MIFSRKFLYFRQHMCIFSHTGVECARIVSARIPCGSRMTLSIGGHQEQGSRNYQEDRAAVHFCRAQEECESVREHMSFTRFMRSGVILGEQLDIRAIQ